MRNETYHRGQRQQSLSVWNVLIIVAITLVIAIGLYILFEDPPDTSTQRQQPGTQTQESITGVEKPYPKPGAAARNIIAQIKAGKKNLDFDEIYNKAQAFSADNQLEDAHLLLFYAARSGHIPSARTLGGMYDPNNYDSSKSIIDEPDLTQAHKWYKIAADSGDPIAIERLNALKVIVQEAADNGSEEAKAIILKWN